MIGLYLGLISFLASSEIWEPIGSIIGSVAKVVIYGGIFVGMSNVFANTFYTFLRMFILAPMGMV